MEMIIDRKPGINAAKTYLKKHRVCDHIYLECVSLVELAVREIKQERERIDRIVLNDYFDKAPDTLRQKFQDLLDKYKADTGREGWFIGYSIMKSLYKALHGKTVSQVQKELERE